MDLLLKHSFPCMNSFKGGLISLGRSKLKISSKVLPPLLTQADRNSVSISIFLLKSHLLKKPPILLSILETMNPSLVQFFSISSKKEGQSGNLKKNFEGFGIIQFLILNFCQSEHLKVFNIYRNCVSKR